MSALGQAMRHRLLALLFATLRVRALRVVALCGALCTPALRTALRSYALRSFAFRTIALLAATLFAAAASAHSASDAYLTLTAEPARGAHNVVHAQWDIALRDLDFVLALDANGDGNITWAELRDRQRDIARYVYPTLSAASGEAACTITPTAQKIVDHADGTYAAMLFDIACPGNASAMLLDYRLFFAIDPSHRGIVVMRNGNRVATSLLAPGHASVRLAF